MARLRVGEAQQRARRAGGVEVQLLGVVMIRHRQRRGDRCCAADQQPPLRGQCDTGSLRAERRVLGRCRRSLAVQSGWGQGPEAVSPP